jgi:hypothetical protein
MTKPRVSDEWIGEVIATGAVPSINLVSAPDVCMDLRDARAELAAMRPVVESLRAWRDAEHSLTGIPFSDYSTRLREALNTYERGQK